MTLEEAQQIGEIIAQADGGCSYCVESLRSMCEEAFPQFNWITPPGYCEPVLVTSKEQP